MDQFKGKDLTFVSEWLAKKGLNKLCSIFEGTYEKWSVFKDGASFCYCAYVLRISGYLGFLRNLPTNTTIFLRGL